MVFDLTSGWQNFDIMTGGAAAALTGLVFVSLSLHTRAIMAHPLYRDRALATIQSLLALLFLSAAVLVPNQPGWVLGLEVLLVAVWFIQRSVYAVRLHKSVDKETRRRPGSSWFLEWAAWLAWLALLVASAIAVMYSAPAGLYLLAIAMLYMF